MNSIYNEDITMNHKNNNINNYTKQGFAALSAEIIATGVEEIANNLDITGEERDLLLEAGARCREYSKGSVDALANSLEQARQINDWQDAALSATDERDRLRVLVANHEARIELLVQNINRLERCVIQNALNTSRLARMEEEETDDKIVFHAGRLVQNQIDHERHNDESDLENGDL